MNEVLKSAIEERQVVCFYYENLLREVEPYVLGVTRKGGEVLRGFQTGGQTKSGRLPCWRLFKIELVERIYLAGRSFQPRQEQPPKDDLAEIHARI